MADVKSNKFGRRDEDECGERGEHGHRGHEGHAGATGVPGATGVTGATGATGAAGAMGAAGAPGSGSAPFRAAFRAPSDPHFPGMPVFIAFLPEIGGISTVQPTDVRAAEPKFSAFAETHGLIVAVNDDGTVQVQASGPVTLSTAQWDAATGESGGLVLGRAYYPAIFPKLGLTDVAPSSPGTFRVPVGVALNATTLLLTLASPVQVLGDSIFFAVNTGAAPPVGTLVCADGADRHITPAVNSGTLLQASPVGVIAAYKGTTPIVQTRGIVTLSGAEWDAVMDTGIMGIGGLNIGRLYYVGGTAGLLTSTRPAKPPVVIAFAGISLSATQLLLGTPSVPIQLT